MPKWPRRRMRKGRGSLTPPTSNSACALIAQLYSPWEACHAVRPASRCSSRWLRHRGHPGAPAAVPTAEVCYLGLSDAGKRAMAMDEVKRRSDACENHKDEIARIYESEPRAS